MDDSQRDSVALRMDMPGYTHTTGAYWQGTWMPSSNHLLKVKVDGFSNTSYAEMTMYPEGVADMFMLTWPEVQRTALGIFISDRWQLPSRWQISASGRLEGNYSQPQSQLGLQQIEIFFSEYSGQSLAPAGNVKVGVSKNLGKALRLNGLLSWGSGCLPSQSSLGTICLAG